MDGQDRKRRGWPKGRKRPKTMKDINAPKKPVTGYVMFMRDRREDVMMKNPSLGMIEATKLLGEKWTSLPEVEKAAYLSTAESEKEKYLKTLGEYHKSDEYKKFIAECEMEFKQEAPIDQSPTVNEETSNSGPQSADIPIFTEAFLDHNKEKESELHRLTKTNAEYEQQNCILETHLDNLRNAIVKLDAETASQNAKNKTLFTKLNQFRSILFSAFAKTPLPTTGALPTCDTIDSYMHEMFEILQSDVDSNAEFAQNVHNVVSTLNFQPTVSGAAAGFAVDTSLFPVDTIKTRLQSKEGFIKSGGFRRLYAGIGSVLLGSAPGSAVFFTFYDGSRHFLNNRFDVKSPVQHMLVDMATASFGEVMACTVRVPVEVVKQRAQVNKTLKSIDVFRKSAKEEGFRGFYRGYGSTVMREIPFSIIQFPLWEFLKYRWAKSTGREKVNPWQSACCGFVSGGFSAAVTTPLDVAKTRIMLAQTKDVTASSNFAKVIFNIYKTEGAAALFCGSVPRTMFVALGGFIFLGIYDLTKNIISN